MGASFGTGRLPERITTQTMIDRQSQRNITAYHEAGHAVAAVLRGGWVGGIDIEPDIALKQAGTAQLGSNGDRAFVAFAGPWAETRFQWLGERVDENGCDRHGWTFIDRLRLGLRQNPQDMRACSGAPWRKRLGWADELETHWPAIDAIAGLLLRDYNVTTAQVRTALNQPETA